MSDLIGGPGLSASETSASFTLGEVVTQAGIDYQYIQIHASSASAATAGSAIYQYAAATDFVGNTTALIANVNLFLGVAVGAIAVGSYGWIQISGLDTVYIDQASSVSTLAAGSPVYGCSTDKAVAMGTLYAAASSISSIAGVRQIGHVSVPTVTSTSCPRTCGILIYRR